MMIAPDRSFCFARSGRLTVVRVAPPRIGLRDAHAEALAVLVPLLGCGEEAAALAFDGLADAERDPAAAAALAAIGAEERVHDAMLKAVMAALPVPGELAALRRAARRFHIELGVGCPAAHLARIAAIDAGVCTLLSRLLHAGTPLANDPALAALLGGIHRDEARHVRVSRRLAAARLPRAELDGLAAAARGALANIVALAGDAFEALGVDAQRLRRDLARVPDGLFAA